MLTSKPITRIFAFLAALSLALPNPSLALRVEEASEDPARKAGLEQGISTAAAGTEERTPGKRVPAHEDGEVLLHAA